MALHAMLGLDRPEPAVRSYVVAGARRTVVEDNGTTEYYPLPYSCDDTLVGHLRFALRYEPLDLGIVCAALCAVGGRGLAEWVRAEPTGRYSRRAWFLYEELSGETLDLEPVSTGNYVDALDQARHFVADPRNSRRQRVRNNLLGNRLLCPMVRRTPRLEQMCARALATEARELTAHCDPDRLARAVSFLYTKETRSSFAIEGEAPSRRREARFLQALRTVEQLHPSKDDLIALQRGIVDSRYAADDWRAVQSFVSDTTRGFGQHVHFICPQPADVPDLIDGWMDLTRRLLSSPLDAVVSAAVVGFAFVFIHPFEDGNGRIHRFLLHHVLATKQFTPPGLVFPISATILRERHLYDRALDAFSSAILPAIEWHWTTESALQVTNETRDLYRFFDATPQAEYLYERVAETIRVDLKEELGFLQVYDAAYQAVQRIVDMPNTRAALLVQLLLQNGGRLSKTKRERFDELADDEVQAMEAAVRAAMGEFGHAATAPVDD